MDFKELQESLQLDEAKTNFKKPLENLTKYKDLIYDTTGTIYHGIDDYMNNVNSKNAGERVKEKVKSVRYALKEVSSQIQSLARDINETMVADKVKAPRLKKLSVGVPSDLDAGDLSLFIQNLDTLRQAGRKDFYVSRSSSTKIPNAGYMNFVLLDYFKHNRDSKEAVKFVKMMKKKTGYDFIFDKGFEGYYDGLTYKYTG